MHSLIHDLTDLCHRHGFQMIFTLCIQSLWEGLSSSQSLVESKTSRTTLLDLGCFEVGLVFTAIGSWETVYPDTLSWYYLCTSCLLLP